MKFFTQIVKILLLGVWLYGSSLLAQTQSITDTTEHNQTIVPDLRLCKNFKELKKSDIFLGLNSLKETREFYIDYCKHSDALAWSDESLHLNHQAKELIQSIRDSYDEGLNPNKYHLQALEMQLEAFNNEMYQSGEEKQHALNRIDVLLSDAYISLANDLYYGFTNWKRFKESKKEQNKKLARNNDSVKNDKEDTIEWERPVKTPIYPSKYLMTNLTLDKISDSLSSLSPDSAEYHRLKESLKYFRTLHANGGWGKIPEGPTIRIKQSDERVSLIKKRLYVSGDYHERENNETILYNEIELIDAVKSFQTRHNLTNDGLIGKKTINALNISSSSKVSKIILNMERYRWFNNGMDQYQSYIDINIPAFQMQVLEEGKEVIEMKVIVGKKKRPTPILNSKISYAVLNPTWTAPTTIVKEDILQKDNMQEYLLDHNMRVYATVDGELVEVNYDEIDWSLYSDKEYVPYVFKADAGESNPLGVVKFIFNNKYSVYMHDTNQRYLFKNEYRALSSGCLRLSEPMKLLSYLLEKKDAIIDKEEDADFIVNLKKKVPVVIRYMTVSVDKNNLVYFYDDIYGYDALQRESIKDNSWML